jgi:hypothetical protein
MQHAKSIYVIYPVLFVVVVVAFIVGALLIFDPNAKAKDCACSAPIVIPHSHGYGLARAVQNDMQLIFNVSPATELYQINDQGKLELCGDISSGDMRHVTVDVIDAGVSPGERLPVHVDLVIRNEDSIVVEAATPAMYSLGHGYHFGDNFRLPADVTYNWTVTISPVQALRQEGTQDIWLEPVTWEGTFTLNADGTVAEKPASIQPIGEFTASGLHISLGQQDAIPLYEINESGDSVPLDLEPGSRYFVVDVTDHLVNLEEKLPGAEVTLTFQQDEQTFDVPLDPVISPVYGFHYGANVVLEPGLWQITVHVGGLDILRHAGATVGLGRIDVSQTFTLEED